MDIIRTAYMGLKAELVLLALGLSFVLCAGTYQLANSPAIWYDEGFYTQLAMNLAEGHGQVLQVAPDSYVSSWAVTAGFPLTAPVAFSYMLFGTGVLQGRAVSVLFMVLFASAAYVLARRLFGVRSALFALAFVGTYPTFYGNGKSVLGEVPGLFFLMLTLLALLWLERSEWKDMRAYILTGIAAGLCIATKPIFILLGPAGIIAVLLATRVRLLSIVGTILTTIAFIGVMSVWFVLQFGVSDSLSSVLAFYLNPYDAPVGSLGHLIFSNIRRFFTELSPLYTLAFSGLWALAIGFRVWKKESISAAEWTAFLYAAIVLLFYLRTPGWYRYFFPATMLALVFAPHALRTLARHVSSAEIVHRLSVLALVPLLFLQAYQLRWDSWVASYYGSTRTETLQTFIASIPNATSIFIYNSPELVVLVAPHPYYQFILPHPEQKIGEEQLARLKGGSVDLVFVNGATYRADPSLFARYRVKEEVSRYTVLEKI